VGYSAEAWGIGNHDAGSGRPATTEAMDMRCYSNAHRFYAGVDLHARTMYVHVLDHKGQTPFLSSVGRGPGP